jgi:hypothetical protein
MKTIEKCAAQGDVLFRRVEKLPNGLKLLEGGKRVIVAHSETGHHHVAIGDRVRLYGTTDPMICYLVAESAYADVVHERSFDTHETIRFPAGVYEIRRQREWAPEGWRRVED